MTTEVDSHLPGLLWHLGITRAHFAARLPYDWRPLLEDHPEAIATLTLVCPAAADSHLLAPLGSRLMLIYGDMISNGEALLNWQENLSKGKLVSLTNYAPGNDTDILAERGLEIGESMMEFLGQSDPSVSVPTVSLDQTEGEWGGYIYRVRGSGPPLVLLPLQYAPSQWDLLIDRLSQNYCTITVTGANVGPVSSLEKRALGGYLDAVEKVILEADIQPGERILDIGCGPGTLDRWLARYTSRANSIVGVDPSTYLLREAVALAKNDGLDDVINFEESGGDDLPFSDASFDVAISFTAIQFPDADRMLAEMRRVTRPGGRVAVLARGDDRPNLININVGTELKSKVEGVRSKGQNELGCRDASLYQRFYQAGFSGIKIFPQLVVYTPDKDASQLENKKADVSTVLNAEELAELNRAIASAVEEGSFFIAEWVHCAAGINPG